MKRKKLIRNSKGSIKLPNNKTITLREQREYKNLVSKFNRQVTKRLENLSPERKERYKDFNITTDFRYRKKNYSLSKFRNKSEFNEYMRSLRKTTAQYYDRKTMNQYISNYKKGVKTIFGAKDAKPLLDKLNKMQYGDFKKLIDNDDLEDLSYQYNEPIATSAKYIKISNQLGV